MVAGVVHLIASRVGAALDRLGLDGGGGATAELHTGATHVAHTISHNNLCSLNLSSTLSISL